MSTNKASTEQESIERRVSEAAGRLRNRLVQTIGELVRIPSENTPPVGAELECQRYVHERLAWLGLKSEMYDLRGVAGLTEHPLFRTGRDYTNRPNVAAVWPGSGGGRSLLLSGHIDTVPRGSEPWTKTRGPFDAVRRRESLVWAWIERHERRDCRHAPGGGSPQT